MPIRLMVLLAALMATLFGGAASGQEAVPPQIDGTGLDAFAWLADRFGYLGVAVWVAWQLRGYLAAAKSWQGVPIQLSGPVVIQLHADTLSRFVARSERVHEPMRPDDTPSPPPRSKRSIG